MKFSELNVAEADGAILAHTTKTETFTIKKGTRLTAEDCERLLKAGRQTIVVAMLSDTDVHEDVAAKAIAEGLLGRDVANTAAFTGRCNITASADGIVQLNTDLINAINAIDESVTVATLPNYARAEAGQIVATVKIIPFAVTREVLDAVKAVMKTATMRAAGGVISLAPFKPLAVTLINTLLPSLKESVVEKTTDITSRRIQSVGGHVQQILSCDHATMDITDTLKIALARAPDLLVIVGASVTVDRADVVPSAIVNSGGEIVHFGMPVDPGNLVLLGQQGTTRILVLPGCARSPKLNGIDWIFERLAARLPVSRAEIMSLGVGGLLVDSPARPLPRAEAVRGEAPEDIRRNVAAVVLAAGQSRRMGSVNKLLEPVDGEPLIRRTVSSIVNSGAQSVIVVTGHEGDRVKAALSGLDVTFASNPDYADGLSTSLKVGLSRVPPQCDGAVICLGDMPNLSKPHIDALIAAYRPEAGQAIVVPVHKGKRGNPVLWDKRFFEGISEVSGDVGARHLIGTYAELVTEVDFGDTAVLTDLDTPEQWSKFLDTHPT
ncbi:MAG: molybdopterin-binding/glycosyltransferase family 2 protein [Rhodospirillaceae bacterium]